MKQTRWNLTLAVAFGLILLAPGCASYYKVTDPQTGKEYYTKSVDTVSGGAVKLKDARTGSHVTLQNSEVKEITGKEFEAGLTAPAAAAKPAPAPAAAPAAGPAPSSAPAADPGSAAAPAATPSGVK